MSGRVIVIQASSSDDESMSSPTAGGGNGVEGNLSEIQSKGAESPSNSTPQNKILRYDREDMLTLYENPLAKIRPPMLSPEFDVTVENGESGTGDGSNQKLWNPELWIQSIWNPESRQNSSTPTQHGWSNRRHGDHDGPAMSKKKQIDRLKSESEDGIVLSPQRRSFVAGCQVASSSGSIGANIPGSQTASIGGGSTTTTAHSTSRRSTSPIIAGGDERQNASQQNARSSFRSRGGGGANAGGNVAISQTFHNTTLPAVGGTYGRGDRVENWRDRSSYNQSGFGRGNMGKDMPAQINTYSRSARGGMNSWNTGGGGGGRRSYDRGYNHHEETLPEWVTEGPSDMYETMELRGFDEEERQKIRDNSSGMEKHAETTRYKRSDSEMEPFKQRKEHSTKRNSHSPPKHQPQPMPGISNDKIIGKMSAETLVDGFDIGDMAEFLSAAAPDFDSVKNGELSKTKPSSSIGHTSGQVPATPTAASRFSKFFAHSSQAAGNSTVTASSQSDKSPSHMLALQKGQQQQSVNIMDLFSTVAMACDQNRAGVDLTTGTVPAGAKSLDEIEAAYKAASSAQKMEPATGSNKVLQELFQSACSANVPPLPSGALEANMSGNQQQKIDLQQRMNQLSDLAQQQASETLQKGLQHMGSGGIVTKGNPLADPAQQQHLLEQLRKLHMQQQQIQQSGSQLPSDFTHRHPGITGPNDAMNPFLAAYPQLAGFQHLLQQQQQAAQLSGIQAALANTGRVPSPLAGPIQSLAHSGSRPPVTATAAMNPAFVGMLPPPNVPPPPITQQDLLLAQHTQSIYQRAVMNRRLDEPPSARPTAIQSSSASGSKVPTEFLPTSVIKQMHSGVKTNKEGGEETAMGGTRPIVKQQQQMVASIQQHDQISPNSATDPLRNLQIRTANKAIPSGPAASGMQGPPLAPPPSMTPQDLQRLIDQTHLQQRQQQRQHQERLIFEQLKAQQHQQQQQLGNNPAAAMNPAALAIQNNPMLVQMLRAQQAMQAQQMAMLQQQATGPGLPHVPTIPASAAVSAIPNAAQLVRARLAAPPPQAATAASNPDLMRHMLQQQQQQILLNQLRQQGPAEANLLLNRLLTGQVAQQQQHVHQMPPAGLQYAPQMMGDAKPMTVEELERLHKQAAMQQPQS